MSDRERDDLRWGLTDLRRDLQFATHEALPALSASGHRQLCLAALDAAGHWRAERKRFRPTVAALDKRLAGDLDDALTRAVGGDLGLMVAICDDILAGLGGPIRTCRETYPSA